MPADALDYITIKGFKSIKSIERLPMRPINILIGANGSGKSNFIGAFKFLRDIRQGLLKHAVGIAGGADRLLHFGRKLTQYIQFEIGMHESNSTFAISLEADDLGGLFVHAEDFSTLWEDDPLSRAETLLAGREARISLPPPSAESHPLLAAMPDWLPYHLQDTSSTSRMGRSSDLHNNHSLNHDASNLASFLYLLCQRHPGSYESIRSAVQLVAPFFDDFHLEPMALNPEMIRLEWRHRDSDQFFDVSSLSDGTLRFIALATLLLQPPQLMPSLIIIDEPEIGLHPAAIEILAALIQRASLDTQLVLATQSSRLIDHFEPEDILVAEREEGATKFQRLDSSHLKVWLESYSLGELWEKNEFGGRPKRD